MYASDCKNVYTDTADGFRTKAQACAPGNCKSSETFPAKDYVERCPPGSVVENFQVFGKDSNNNSSVKIIIIISVVVILCLLGFLAYRHMNKKK
jgi:hypothetical protein